MEGRRRTDPSEMEFRDRGMNGVAIGLLVMENVHNLKGCSERIGPQKNQFLRARLLLNLINCLCTWSISDRSNLTEWNDKNVTDE